MRLIESILADAASITQMRRDIHAHPELCFEEQRTSDLIAKALTDWGIPVHRGMGKTGVVGIVKNGSSKRADRPARRHRCAADDRAQSLRPRQPARRQDACVRPRRPHRDAAGGGQAPEQAPHLRRHRVSGVPAGRRRRRRRARDDEGRPVRAVPDGGHLRRAQLARHGGGAVRVARRPGVRIEQRVQDHRQGQGRARRHAAQRHRSGAGGLPDGAGVPDHHQPQQAADRHRRHLGDDDPHR